MGVGFGVNFGFQRTTPAHALYNLNSNRLQCSVEIKQQLGPHDKN